MEEMEKTIVQLEDIYKNIGEMKKRIEILEKKLKEEE